MITNSGKFQTIIATWQRIPNRCRFRRPPWSHRPRRERRRRQLRRHHWTSRNYPLLRCWLGKWKKPFSSNQCFYLRFAFKRDVWKTLPAAVIWKLRNWRNRCQLWRPSKRCVASSVESCKRRRKLRARRKGGQQERLKNFLTEGAWHVLHAPKM